MRRSPLLALSLLAMASPASAQGYQPTSREVYYMDLTVFEVDVLHLPDVVELDMLLDLPVGAPPPAGFTQLDYNEVTGTFTGLYDATTGAASMMVQVRDHVQDIEEVEIYIDATLVASASRGGGSGLFVDRGAYSYVTLWFQAQPFPDLVADVLWRDAGGVVTGVHTGVFE